MSTQTTTVNGQLYTLTFEDDFLDPALSAWQGHGTDGIWATSHSPHLHDGRYIATNGEEQYYVDPDSMTLASPFSIANGVLSINAYELTAAEQAEAGGQHYGSGLLTTQMTFSAEGGYVEIRADVPDEQGFLSAFWMLPADGSWSSEIDVFEILGREPTLLNTNVWDDGVGAQQSLVASDLSAGFHSYGLQWTDTEINWLLDGQIVRTATNTIDGEMYLALSLIVGSTWAGATDNTTDFSDGLNIDYIRFYEDPNTTSNALIPTGGQFTSNKTYGDQPANETLYGTRWRDVIEGGDGNDEIYGRRGKDALYGEDGDDSLYGQKGADLLVGGDGNDKLVGGKGKDTLIAGTGTDHLWGGSYAADGASDVFVFGDGDGKNYVHDFEIGLDQIDLSDLATDWNAVSSAMQDQSWATYIDMAQIGGITGDKLYLVGVETAQLTAADFDFGAVA